MYTIKMGDAGELGRWGFDLAGVAGRRRHCLVDFGVCYGLLGCDSYGFLKSSITCTPQNV